MRRPARRAWQRRTRRVRSPERWSCPQMWQKCAIAGAQLDTVGIPTFTSLNLLADQQTWRRQPGLKDLTSTTLSTASMSPEHCEYVIVGRQSS